MKVLMLGWELPPHNSGGLGVACYQMCRALARRGVDIEFVLPYHADHGIDFMRVTAALPQDAGMVQRSGIAYDSMMYYFDDGRVAEYTISGQQQLYEGAIGRVVEGQQYDIIHAHDWLTFRAGLRARELLGRPLVLHVHSIESDRAGGPGGNPLVRDIEDLAFHAADRIIAISNFTRRAIIRDYHIPADRITVVHNAMDCADMIPAGPPEATTYRYLAALRAQGYRIVVNIGRLTIQKGLPNLLRAARLVIEKHARVMFLIVGSGEQYHELVELAAQLGIARHVIFTDFQRGKAWRDAFAIGDLFVLPSVSEPFGLTPLEAIGYGTPALISKQSGVSEILHHALKVDHWDIAEMANQITAVVQQDVLRDELAANASRELEGISWMKAADRIRELYQQHAVAGAAA